MSDTTSNPGLSKDMGISVFILDTGTPPPIWGMSPARRIEKQLKGQDVEICHHAPDTHIENAPLILLRNDGIYDQSVLQGLLRSASGTFLTGEDGAPMGACITGADKAETAIAWLCGHSDAPADVTITNAAGIAGTYNAALRKKEPPYCFILRKDNRQQAEWRTYMGAYKGVTDFVTKYIWPVPAFHVTRLCARIGLTPNMVTSIGALLMLAALWLFWHGHFGWGLLLGWVMCFLDTVDGKLARVTMTSSQWGNIFDHGIDLIHPPFWYIAWGMGLAASPAWLVPGLWAMFITYVLGRLCEGYFKYRHGFHIHVWRKIDSVFRLIVARRNPNLFILTLAWIAGMPGAGLLAVIIWHVMAVPVHLIQIVHAEIVRKHQKAPLQSWLTI